MKAIHILHTNDLHSHFEAVPSIAQCIEEEKRSWERMGEKVIIVDIGDHADRARMNTEASWGQANVEVMNAMGYDWITIGNNEGLTFPKERLLRLYDGGKATVLCCNFKEADTKLPPAFMQRYAVQDVNGIRIGWTGLTASYPDFYSLLGWEVEEPFEALRNVVAELRPQVDLLIVLSHIGLPKDREMAKQVPGIDLIIGGHTHHLLPHGEKVEDTWIAHAGKFGDYVGHVHIKQDSEWKQKGKWEFAVDCLASKEYEGNDQVSELIRNHLHAAEKQMEEVVAVIDEKLPLSWEAESPLGNLLAEGLRHWTGADIGMVNSGQFLFSLNKGTIQRKTLLAICPHPINPCSMRLTGLQIRRILEEALLEENISRQFRGFGFRGSVLGWMSVDGLEITYNPSMPPYHRVVSVKTEHGFLEDHKLYIVGTIDMFTFGVLFPTFMEGLERRYFLPEFLRDVLARQLENGGALRRCGIKRWLMEN